MTDLPPQIKRLVSHYEHNPIIRTLVQLIPYGSAVEVALVTTINDIREDRARAFFDELASKDIELTEEEIKSEPFLHSYFSTTRAALNTRRREKIRLFARLLATYIQGKRFETTDSYEESLTILDDLSLRELQILLILHRFETSHPIQEGENALKRALKFWEEFLKAVESEVRISGAEIPGFLARLNRSGLYQTITGTYWDYTGDRGYLTPNFEKFLDALGITDKAIAQDD